MWVRDCPHAMPVPSIATLDALRDTTCLPYPFFVVSFDAGRL